MKSGREITLEGLLIFALVVGFIIYVGISLHEGGLLIPLFVLAGVIWFCVVVYKKMRKQEAEEQERQDQIRLARAAAEQQRQMEENDRKRYTHQKSADLLSIVNDAEAEIANLPMHLKQSETSIGKAVERLQKRSFYPFWDSVGEAVEGLQKYLGSFDALDSLRGRYTKTLAEYKAASKPSDGHMIKRFPADSHALPVLRSAGETAKRIDQLYEVAHSDFEFSNIYANWRTNRTLVEGFESLSSGLRAIQDDLESINFTLVHGFEATVSAVYESTSEIVDSIDSLASAVERQSEQMASYQGSNKSDQKDDYAQSAKQDEMIKQLKNIQHGRVDIPKISDIGYYMGTTSKK